MNFLSFIHQLMCFSIKYYRIRLTVAVDKAIEECHLDKRDV